MCIHNKGLALDITKDSQEQGKGRDVAPHHHQAPTTGHKHSARDKLNMHVGARDKGWCYHVKCFITQLFNYLKPDTSVLNGFTGGLRRQKHPQVHADTNPPICNSVHSNKLTPTEANSLALTRRRKSPPPETRNTLTLKKSAGVSEFCGSTNFSTLFQSCRLLRLKSVADLQSVGLFAWIPRLYTRCQARGGKQVAYPVIAFKVKARFVLFFWEGWELEI